MATKTRMVCNSCIVNYISDVVKEQPQASLSAADFLKLGSFSSNAKLLRFGMMLSD